MRRSILPLRESVDVRYELSFALDRIAGCGVALRAQDTPRIWQGVYTTAQAERGKAVFNTTCLRCHGEDLGGTRRRRSRAIGFRAAGAATWSRVCSRKIRDTMPPNFGTILDDQVKLDIVTYILQTNGFPAGTSELHGRSATWRTRRF